MTTEELKQYYADLLILQYKGKPKASAHIKQLVDMVIADQIPKAVESAFDLDNAVGVQLEVIGKYAGVRKSDSPVDLTDPEFRQIVRLAIIQNSNGSSTFDIQTLINLYFENQIYFFDYQTMRVSYYIDTDFWSEALIRAAVGMNLLPYPMALQRSSNIYADTGTLTSFYGFRTYGAEAYNASPMNDYADYQSDYPWLNYSYAVIPSISRLTTEGGDTLTTEDGEELIL
jgi:hypothetical protein